MAAGGEVGEGSSTSTQWHGASFARKYKDVTDQIDVKGLELRNYDSEFGNARTPFETSQPSSLGKGKAVAFSSTASGKDWIESDTDPELMLYIPFQSTLKIHSIQITSLPPHTDDDADDETPMRPKELRFFINTPNIIGFDEDIAPTQTIEVSSTGWHPETGTAIIELRYVKFQKVSSLCIFVVSGDGDGEKTRIDRIRIIGDSGEKRDMGKLEKIGDDPGE